MKTDKKWINQLPNQLTFFRIAIVPVILFLFPLNIQSINLFCALLFCLASLTDWLDGFLARQLSLESRIGAILDPIADKLLTVAGLVCLAGQGKLWIWMVGFLLCREIAISGIRSLAEQQGSAIPVSIFGKFKTLFLDVAIVCLMVDYPLFDWPFHEVGMVSVWLAFAASYYSAWSYVRVFLAQESKDSP